jgi:hypothetical protein
LKGGLVLGICATCSLAATVAGAASPLVPARDQIGFSLNDDWREVWRRTLDRHGRVDALGPIQQRFAGDHRPETEEAQAVSDYALGDEWAWSRSGRGVRWWVHSYDAVRLGTHAQLEYGAPISDTWSFEIRFDRLYTPAAHSDLLQGDFVWRPPGPRGFYTSISFFPRIEKEDTDVGFTIGYHDDSLGQARLRMFALDPFSNAAYSLASTFDFSEDTVITRQLSPPIAFAAELESVRLGGWRLESYLGGVLPQARRVYTEEFTQVRRQAEAALLFGGLLEYRVPSAPLWAGVSGLAQLTSWEDEEEAVPGSLQHISEQTYQGRAYLLAVFNPNLRLETQLRATARPEQRDGPHGQRARRKDHEYFYHTRLQWLITRRAGVDVSYWRTFREASGLPDVNVEGRALRLDLRVLLRYERFLATFGVGLNPLRGSRPVYAGGGGNMVLLLD